MSMDLPNFLHHQNLHSHNHNHNHNQVRYVSVPNSSPHYPDDPNSQIPRYHHHHHVLQPPPPPPPPQTRPLQPLPPPQPSPFHPPPTVHGHPYNPGQSQFAYANPSHDRTFEDDHHPRSSYPLREFAPSPTVSHRLPVVDDDRPRHRLPEFDPDSRHDFWEKSRVLAENLPERTHLPLEFESGSQKFQFDHKPMSPYKTGNRVRHDSETSSRFRVEYADACESKHRDEVLRGHEDEKYGRSGNFLPSSGTSFQDVGFVSNSGLSVRNLESESENYHGNRYGLVYDKELFRGGRRDVVYENQRRVHHDRKVPRDAHKSSFERGSGEVSNGDGAYFVSHKREYYGSESGRYNIRGMREDGHEFNRTPRKQTQKRSALLRLQKQNHRNTESEQLQYSAYHDNSSSSYFRRRDHYVKMANGVDEGEEEGTPVELDVSFKDNSLVAKPILAPVSCSEVNDANSTPRNMKGGQDSVADRDCSNAELTKLSDNAINEDSSLHLANSASTFEKKVIQSEGKAKDMCDASSLACLSETNHSLEKKEVQRSPTGADLDKVGTKVGPNKPSLKVVKKKKVVKKTVKKVLRPHSQPKKKHDETVNADVLVLTPSEASEIEKVAASLSYPCPNETNMLHAGKKVEGSAMAIELEKHGIDESQTKCETQIEKNGNNFDTCLGSSSPEEIKIDKNSENIEYSAQGIHAMSNNDEVLVKSFNKNALLDIANVVDANQSCQSGDSLLLDNELDKDSSPITLTIRDKVDSALLNLESIKMHDNLTSLSCSANSTDATLDIVLGTKVLKEENPVQGEISKATTARGSATIGLSSPGENTMDACTSDHDTDRVTSPGYNNKSICEENITLSRSGTVDCNIKQPTTNGSSGLPENSTIGSPRNTKSSVGDIEGATPLVRKKRNIRSQLDVSRTTNIDLDPVNVSNPAIAMDTKLSLSFEDPSCEVAAVSSMGSLDDGLQPGKSWACGSSEGLPEANLIGKDGADGFRVTSRRRKRRKVSASHLAMSSPTTFQTDEQPVADTSTFSMEEPLPPNDVLAQQNMELDTAAKAPVRARTDLMNTENEITVLHENKLLKGCSDAVGVVSFVNDERQKDDGVVMAVDDNQIEVFNVQSRREEEVGMPASNGQVIAQHETPQCTTSSGIQPPDTGKSSPFTDMESDNRLVKDDFPNLPNYSSSPHDCSGAISIDEAMDFVPDSLTITSSLQTSFDLSDVHMSDVTSVSDISKQICREDEKLEQKSLEEKGSEVSAQKSVSHCTKSTLSLDSATESDQTIEGKTAASPLQDSRSMSHSLNITSVESNGQKSQLGQAVSRTFPGRSSFGPATLKKKATSIHANPRTWHRNGNSFDCPLPRDKTFSKIAPSQKQLPERDGKVQSTSYVRKGNSLVRKPSPTAALSQGSPSFSPSVCQLNSAGSDESKRRIESDNRVGVGNTLGSSGVAETKASCDNPRSLPTQSANKQPNYVAISSGDCRSSPSADPLFNGSCETNSEPISSSENNETPKLVEDSSTSEAFENQNFQLNSLDNQTKISNENLASLNIKQIVYVKCKSNQLVATSNSIDRSVANADICQTSSFDGYYKRKKNQLIRTSLESTKQLAVPDDNFQSGVQMTLGAIPSRRSSKRCSDKVVPKTFKRSTNSLVWTLCSTQLTKVNSGSLYHQKFLPHLFPWKRTTYWRSFLQNANLIYKSSSLAISKKLLLSRKRDTVYTRSINGFSLRKSKVLSVGGASLKWSKSIESCSKRANEEATLAVVAVEKKKKEQKGATCISSGWKNRNHSSRERIFRIGSSRYKMDPSRRTLRRISDDESSCATSTHPDKDAKRSYIPRRLLIGNDEYVRIGNGNQLIRNPKKRTRILASEKVRWSLHTARLRLAKKGKYCQFFTRFGKCNKDTGKCPYIHDPSKIAVCTKFLNGLCSNANCKLTHKVIPERMPDCSYFLQGLCTNQNCPYRHVNVNPKASTCEGFLRGYCADGNECRKKHSYVCPTFEATGTCPQGLKCKLHHPKSRIHGKKKKRSRELKNARGRYFGSPDISTSDSRITVSEKHFEQDSNGIFLEGKCADFIAIDVSEDECNDSRNEQITFCDSDTSDLESEDLDALIKPLRVMDTSLTA